MGVNDFDFNKFPFFFVAMNHNMVHQTICEQKIVSIIIRMPNKTERITLSLYFVNRIIS